MSDVFIVYLFYFQINKNITIFCCIESTFYMYARIYQTHDIEYSASILHIYNTNNLHRFSIFYNISIFSFLNLCVSKCVAWKIFYIYFLVCNYIVCIIWYFVPSAC